MALTELVDNIATAIDKKFHTISVFLNLEKAFDTIDHPLLLKKLRSYGIRGIANHWLSSYLNDICNVSSDIKYVPYADDASILCSNNNKKYICYTINKHLEELKNLVYYE